MYNFYNFQGGKKMDLKSKLNFVIDNFNVSMLSISKQSGISYQTIRQISLDKNANPTQKTVRKLTEYLNKIQK